MSLKSAKQIPIAGIIDEAGSSKKFKTGDWRSFRPIWNKDKCTQCMICTVLCPDDAIPTEGKGNNIKRKETNLDYCKGCLICENVCPVKAISHKEEAEFIK